jgi:hypothetical protein
MFKKLYFVFPKPFFCTNLEKKKSWNELKDFVFFPGPAPEFQLFSGPSPTKRVLAAPYLFF